MLESTTVASSDALNIFCITLLRNCYHAPQILLARDNLHFDLNFSDALIQQISSMSKDTAMKCVRIQISHERLHFNNAGLLMHVISMAAS